MSPRGREIEATLSIKREGGDSIVIRLEKSEIRVGSSPLCDVSIPQSGLKDFHFEISNRGERYFIRAMEGVEVCLNQKILKEEMALTDGDIINAGSLMFVLNISSARYEGSTAVLPEDTDRGEVKRAYLILRTQEQERIYDLKPNTPTLIGSGREADIVIDDRYVSEKHCTIFSDKGSYFIRDNLSRNGTIVNGVKTREAEIKSGSLIRIGKTELLFKIESTQLGIEIEDSNEFCGISGFSSQMKEIFALIKKVAPTEVPVLITGETGTGKELVARAIHKCSQRADRIFIPVNCSSIPKDVIESELFGHTKGAFTGAVTSRKGIFEEATNGTVFLDEIGDMPLDLQAKILRTIEYGEIRSVGSNKPISVNTRIISATNRDLERDSKSGRFREDLYYRLGVVHIHIPPLRERREDIIPIAEMFLLRFSPGRGLRLTTSAREKLLSYGWYGNVRELKNVMIRAVLFSKGEEIDDPAIIFQSTALKEYIDYADKFIKVKPLSLVEKEIIENAMTIYNQDIGLVAERLDISVSELKEKLKNYGK